MDGEMGRKISAFFPAKSVVSKGFDAYIARRRIGA